MKSYHFPTIQTFYKQAIRNGLVKKWRTINLKSNWTIAICTWQQKTEHIWLDVKYLFNKKES